METIGGCSSLEPPVVSDTVYIAICTGCELKFRVNFTLINAEFESVLLSLVIVCDIIEQCQDPCFFSMEFSLENMELFANLH